MWHSWDDVTTDFDDWCILLRQLDGDDDIAPEVWAMARQHERMPHLGNIRQSLIAERLYEAINSRWPFLQVEYHINAICSYFSINGEAVTTLRDVDAAIGEYYRENEISA